MHYNMEKNTKNTGNFKINRKIHDKKFKKNRHEPSMKTFYNKKFAVPLKKKRKNEYNPEEEARLERIVFGDTTDIIDNLVDEVSETKQDESVSVIVKDDEIDSTKEVETDDDDSSDVEDSESITSDLANGKKPAWRDEDDTNYTVSEAFEAQNRKLRGKHPQKYYAEFLKHKYKALIDTPKWAELDKTDRNELDEIDSDVLKHSCHIEKAIVRNLAKNIIDIKALKLINKETHNEGSITSLEFHPSSTVALVAGTSGILSIFQIDGIQNNKLHTMRYEKFPISKARFLKDGTEIVCGSQYYSHCYTYDLMSGKTHRVPLPHGITNMKNYEVSPDGKLIALCGKAGEVYLLTSATKELVGTLKMNTKCRALAFSTNSKTLITHGDSNEMYIWDVTSRRCIHRAIDDGCLSCASVAMSFNGQFLATGSKEGAVNIYDTRTVLEKRNPTPLKIVLNLVTSITALKFNPTSEILSMASNEKNNAFKMVHIPSFTVFSNFPTLQTTMGMPTVVEFSPGSGYLGVANKFGSAYLYRLKHYGNY